MFEHTKHITATRLFAALTSIAYNLPEHVYISNIPWHSDDTRRPGHALTTPWKASSYFGGHLEMLQGCPKPPGVLGIGHSASSQVLLLHVHQDVQLVPPAADESIHIHGHAEVRQPVANGRTPPRVDHMLGLVCQSVASKLRRGKKIRKERR